jgi:hypothetical protein
MRKQQDQLGILMRLVEESYERKAWHGPNLRGSLRGLDVKTALWRHSPKRHNIWEVFIHCAYWKYVVRRRILGEKRGSFPYGGSNWFRSPDRLTSEELRKDIALLSQTHRKLIDAIESLRSSDLSRIPRNSRVSIETTVRGIALHDVYHAGQIQLLKKLQQ